MRVAIDTNRLSDYFRGDADLAGLLSRCEEVWVPLVVLGEIRAGFRGGARQQQNEAMLQRFLEKKTVDLLLPTRETADHYARVFVQLRRSGTPIPDNDVWIAAVVLQHNLTLITRDKHFDWIPQLVLL